MSDVRLSNGSPPLERMDGRLPGHPKPSACRVLFGVPQSEETQREVRRHLRQTEEADSARWNFDFASYRALPPGRYEWEAVDVKESPEFYSRAPRTRNGSDECVRRGACQGSAGTGLSEDPFGLPRKRPAAHDGSSQTKRCRAGPDGLLVRSPMTARAGKAAQTDTREPEPKSTL